AAAWDRGTNNVLVAVPEEYGRTVGITDNTGSFTDFAVFSRITGTLQAFLTSSGHESMRRAYLRNEFGTPFIPLSSGSGESPAFQFFDEVDIGAREFAAGVLRPT